MMQAVGAAGATVLLGEVTTIEYAWTPVQLLASVAVTSKLNVPAAVGVPEIVAPARLRPPGSAPLVTAKVKEPVPPLAVSACE